jgi:GNAT superfamily N-acetyltransferase
MINHLKNLLARKHFTQEVGRYTVLILRLDEYRSSARDFPDGFEFLPQERVGTVRSQEKRKLIRLFDDWEFPYYRKFRGCREDSPIFVMQGDQLVGGTYLCDKNEFDDDPTRGQLHYAFIDPRFQGRGVYSAIFRRVVSQARSWGLQELYLNSDRYMLPEVYLRWGAKSWKTIPKASRLPQNGVGSILRVFYPYLRNFRRQVRRIWLSRHDGC